MCFVYYLNVCMHCGTCRVLSCVNLTLDYVVRAIKEVMVSKVTLETKENQDTPDLKAKRD